MQDSYLQSKAEIQEQLQSDHYCGGNRDSSSLHKSGVG